MADEHDVKAREIVRKFMYSGFEPDMMNPDCDEMHAYKAIAAALRESVAEERKRAATLVRVNADIASEEAAASAAKGEHTGACAGRGIARVLRATADAIEGD